MYSNYLTFVRSGEDDVKIRVGKMKGNASKDVINLEKKLLQKK